MMGFGHGYLGYAPMMGGGILGALLAFVLWALVISGIVMAVIWFVRTVSGSAGHEAPPQAPRSEHDEAVFIARRRLALGEITAEEYAAIMAALNGLRA